MRRTLQVLLTTTVMVLLGSCGAARPSKYYALEMPPVPAATSGNPHDVSLLVGRFSGPHLYRDDRIVYRTSSTVIGTYEYHRWVEPPTDMLETMLLRTLRGSGRFRAIQSMASNAQGDYIVRGRLDEMEEVDGSGVLARVSFEVELYERKSGTTVWTHVYSHDEPVTGKEVPAVVEAMNRNVQRGLDEVVSSLDQYFSSHK